MRPRQRGNPWPTARLYVVGAVATLSFMAAAVSLSACKQDEAQAAPGPSAVQADAPEENPPEGAGPNEQEPIGEARARELLAQWKRAHPDRKWVEEELEKHHIVPPADNSDVIGNPQGHTYGRVTEQDVEMWERETFKLATEGSRIFHDAGQLGSTIGVSCDMCHPDGANTHPETYPKFQVQMGRVAHLRDMINWCIEQASKGERLEADSMKMRALEAYILAQRKGTPLQYGKR